MQAKALQQLLSLPVCGSLISVDRSVDLDDKRRFVAIEVYDEGTDRLLPAELVASQLSHSQRAPEQGLTRL